MQNCCKKFCKKYPTSTMLFKITIHRVVGYFEQRFCAEEEENTETVYVNLRKTDDSGT
jgi:hypothetical protein